MTGTTGLIQLMLALPLAAQEQESGYKSLDTSLKIHSPMLTGPMGLNLTPSARFAPEGGLRLTTSTSDPYAHLSVGVQLTDRLFMGLRQTSEISSLKSLSDRLFPGVNFKYKLWDEKSFRPALAFGAQSAIGHKRQAGEYIVASKSFGDFDLSGGMAWGRLGSAGHIDNPLRVFGGHFDTKRDLDGETLNTPGDWLTGKQAGFFGGIAYHPPNLPVTFKADWGADRYIREAATIQGFDTPDPWSVSIDYTPFEGLDANIGLVGGEKIMGRITLSGLAQNWPGHRHETSPVPPVYPVSAGEFEPGSLKQKAKERHQYLSPPKLKNGQIHTKVMLDNAVSAPKAYGRLMRDVSLHGSDRAKAVKITPYSAGLEGRSLILYPKDMRKAVITHNSSPQEIWRNTSFPKRKDPMAEALPALLTTSRFALEQEISLAENDTSLIARSALTQESRAHLGKRFFLGLKTRLNLGDNFEDLETFDRLRPKDGPVTRSDIARFAEETIGIDRLYASYLATPYNDWHFGVAAGYLEELYGGGAAEVLYRPFKRSWAFGGSLGHVWRRDPETTLNNGFESRSVTTGHLNIFYEIPDTTATLSARIGRYLGEDWGITFGLDNRFDNGVKLKGFVTTTTEKDRDIFGGESLLFSGIEISVPIGSFDYVPGNTDFITRFQPLGRDKGQALQDPLNLYERSEIFSYRHYMNNWADILE